MERHAHRAIWTGVANQTTMLTRHNSAVPVLIEGITSPAKPPKDTRNPRDSNEIAEIKSEIKELQQQLAELLDVEDGDFTIKE